MGLVAQLIVDGIAARGDADAQAAIRDRVAQIVDRFPVPGLPETRGRPATHRLAAASPARSGSAILAPSDRSESN